MPNVLIRDLPHETHAVLVRRAAAQRQSLQAYLTSELERLAVQPTDEELRQQLEESFARLERQGGGHNGVGLTAVEALDEARAENDARF